MGSEQRERRNSETQGLDGGPCPLASLIIDIVSVRNLLDIVSVRDLLDIVSVRDLFRDTA